MARCKLSQCLNCKKTFSCLDGNHLTKICTTCEGTIEAEKVKKNDGLKGVENLKRKTKKKTKPNRTVKDMEKLAKFYD